VVAHRPLQRAARRPRQRRDGGLGIALRNGFAAVATDTGHTVTGPFDASWALNRPDLIEDFGHRALHVSVVNAKKIARALFGEPPRYSYYTGCSKGGQQGLMAAQRYPEDFDGIVVGNPTSDEAVHREQYAVIPETNPGSAGTR
jgi:feruloyl esterase